LVWSRERASPAPRAERSRPIARPRRPGRPGWGRTEPKYGPRYRLTGVLRKLEAATEASSREVAWLDELEAPLKDAARLAGEQEAANAALERARIANRVKFRP
jgi:hypothetical protein